MKGYPFQNYVSSNETGQSLGRVQTEDDPPPSEEEKKKKKKKKKNDTRKQNLARLTCAPCGAQTHTRQSGEKLGHGTTYHLNSSMGEPTICICEKKKDAGQLHSNLQFLYFLNLKFPASIHLLRLYSPVCVGPGRDPNCCSSNAHAHLSVFDIMFVLLQLNSPGENDTEVFDIDDFKFRARQKHYANIAKLKQICSDLQK